MKTIGFVGCTTRDKSFFMMYICKILSIEHKVVLVTENQWFINELTIFEYNDNFEIYGNSESDKIEADYVIIDIDQPQENEYDHLYLLSSARRDDVLKNKTLIEEMELSDYGVIFQNIIIDSKIGIRYLVAKLDINIKEHKIHTQYFSDIDEAAHIENEYNERLDIRNLSKDYKHLLLLIISEWVEIKPRERRKWLRKAERSK